MQRNTSGAPALRQPYLRVLGIELDTTLSSMPGSKAFTPEEEEEFQQLARSEGLYDRFASSVAPSIYGNVDIKKAVVCLLMGGSKKILPDGGRLRGDINVLMLGDPGTAKSQLLKFVEKVRHPIACRALLILGGPDFCLHIWKGFVRSRSDSFRAA